VTRGNCEDSDQWQVLRAEWRTSDGRCVHAVSSDPPLVTTDCSPKPTDEQLWSFEFPSVDRVRIRSVQDGRCVRRPLTWVTSAFAELGACDGVNDLFDTSRGELSVSGRCLDAPSLAFKVCSGSYTQRFALSGPLESQAGVLTAKIADESVDLSVTPSSAIPMPDQIFEFYF
jgi:hypothetical protein